MTKTDEPTPDIRLWDHLCEAERKIRAATIGGEVVTSDSHSQVLHAIFSASDLIKTAMCAALS